MFEINNSFISKSVDQLNKWVAPEKIADCSINLLKSKEINRLNSHEFTHWLGQTKKYLETALKVDNKRKEIQDLLCAELDFRKRHVQIPTILSYGKISQGRLVKEPILQLLSKERIELGIVRIPGKETYVWDETKETHEIVALKKYQLDEGLLEIEFPVDPYRYIQRFFSAKPPEVYIIESKKDADTLVQFLANFGPIKWQQNVQNCEYRAQAAYKYSEALGIDPKSLSFVEIGNRSYQLSNQPLLTFEGVKWSYHVALAITTKEGEIFIIDPSTSPKESLTPKEWQGRINGNHFNIRFESIIPNELDLSTSFAVANGGKLPSFKEMLSERDHPILKSITEKYEE
jgi:hypothetical protein